MGIACPPDFGILSGLTSLTVHIVPKVPGSAVYVLAGGNMFLMCIWGHCNRPLGENVFIVYAIYT